MYFWQIIISLLIYSASCYRVRLTCDQVRAFVDGHNWKRFFVAHGQVPSQPAATNIETMVWDDELAEKAARWAENGLFQHNPDRTICSQRWKNLVGENIHTTMAWPINDVNSVPNITDAIESWFHEHKDYSFQPFQLGSLKPIGHYTQMVWAETNRVGCGISQKKENNMITSLFVCNYGPAGNYIETLPYVPSPAEGVLRCPNGECNKLYGPYC